MKILYYKKDDKWVPGIITDLGVIAVSDLLKGVKRDGCERALNKNDIEYLRSLGQPKLEQFKCIPEAGLDIGPCVPYPSKIICIGLNYRKHAIESNMEIPKVPIVFNKYSNTLAGFQRDIPLGPEGEQFDYEVELGVVIGEKCKNVPVSAALNSVLGYCVANDLSCRDLQFRTSQWLLGKSLDYFLPLGKYMVTSDEISNPQDLELSCLLNGEIRQRGNTSDMIFSVAEIVSFLSRYMTLEPGDLILTGTPSGVIMGMTEKKWLTKGDRVRVEIGKLGYSENQLIG